MEASLISTQALKDRSFVHGNVEDSILRVVIIRVQDTIVEPAIGTPLFKRLLDGIDGDDLSEDEVTLMDNYIVPVMISGCDERAIDAVTYQTRNKTVGLSRDENITPVNESENNRVSDRLKSELNTYLARLVGYLKDNCDLYPEYRAYVCSYENIRPAKKVNRSNISFL